MTVVNVKFSRTLDRTKVVVVPTGHCWVEGDHHGRSVDSNIFGPISMGMITGKATHVVWPPHRWGPLTVQPPDRKRVYRSRARFGQ